jgi:hypothetical protein
MLSRFLVPGAFGPWCGDHYRWLPADRPGAAWATLRCDGATMPGYALHRSSHQEPSTKNARWCRWTDSNRRPCAYETHALTC